LVIAKAKGYMETEVKLIDCYVPVINSKTRFYPAPLEDFYRIDLQCSNCLNEYVADIRKKTSFLEIRKEIECPNCELLDVGKPRQ